MFVVYYASAPSHRGPDRGLDFGRNIFKIVRRRRKSSADSRPRAMTNRRSKEHTAIFHTKNYQTKNIRVKIPKSLR